MDAQLNDIAYLIQFRDRFNKKVSDESVAWHLDHNLKVINKTCNALENSDTTVYEKRFNFKRSLLFSVRYLPRGKGKSPDAVLPPKEIRTENLLSQLELSRKNLEKVTKLDPKVNFSHPLFGQLNRKQTIRFLRMHTNHHLKIVSDILGKK